MLYFVVVENIMLNKYEDTVLFGGNSGPMEIIPAYVKRQRNQQKPKVFILPGASSPTKKQPSKNEEVERKPTVVTKKSNEKEE